MTQTNIINKEAPKFSAEAFFDKQIKKRRI